MKKSFLATLLAVLIIGGAFGMAACDNNAAESDGDTSVAESSSSFSDSDTFSEENNSSKEESFIEEESSAQEDSSEEEDDWDESEEDERPATEGLQYELSEDGTYYIVTGWSAHSVEEMALVIPSKHKGLRVKVIGERAFERASFITEVFIPNSVTDIQDSAFNNCRKLETLTIGKRVKHIGEWAFYGCSALKSLTLPASIKNVDMYAFSSCSGLVDVYYTGEIGDWFKIDFAVGANPIQEADNLYLDNQLASEIIEVTLPDGVEKICDYAFYKWSKLTKITMPASVNYFGSYIFEDCDNLKDIYYMGDINAWCGITLDAFSSIPMRNAENLYIQNRLVSEITEIIIPDTVTQIHDYAFYGWGNIQKIVIHDSVTSVGEEAFFGNDNLTDLTIGKGVKTIGYYAFEFPFSTESILHYMGTVEDWCGISFALGGNPTSLKTKLYIQNQIVTEITEVVIPSTVTAISNDMFSYWTGLKKITIHDNVTSIGNYAFNECHNLTDIVIPDKVTKISDSMFRNCTSLKSVKIPDGVTSIESWAFYDCDSLTEIVIPNGVTSIGEEVFWSCESLVKVVIPDSVTEFGGGAFAYCEGLTSVTIGRGITKFSTSKMYRNATFDGCNNLKDVYYTGNLEDWLKVIGTYSAMKYADNLYLNNQSVTEITEIVIPESITEIKDYAFYGWKWLTKVTLHENVTKIGRDAFEYCENLTEIVIPANVKYIGYYAFQNCKKLTSITFKGTIEQWNAVQKDSDWNSYMPATQVVCSDGSVSLQ